MSAEIDRFKELIAPFRDTWKALEIRTVCLRANGLLVNLATRVLLTTTAAHLPSPPLLDLPFLRMLTDCRSVDTLDQLLDELRTGTVTLAGEVIDLRGVPSDALDARPLSFFVEDNRRSDPRRPPGVPSPSFVLRASGEQIHNILHHRHAPMDPDRLDWALRSADPPYDGLSDLFLHFIEVPRTPWRPPVESTLLLLVAPLGPKLADSSKLFQGQLTLHIEGATPELGPELTLGLIERRANAPLRRRSLPVRGGTPDEGRDCLVIPASIGPDTSSLTVTLRRRGVAIDTLRLEDPLATPGNPRIQTYNAFDRDLDILRPYLSGEGHSSGQDFEIAIAMLLHFCGFNVGPYCRIPRIRDEIDLIAFDPFSNVVLAAECTVGDIDIKGKLSKLSRRTKELQDVLSAAVVLPTVFSPLQSARIARTDLAKAINEGIALVSADEIQNLLDLARRQDPPTSIVRYLQSLSSAHRSLLQLNAIDVDAGSI